MSNLDRLTRALSDRYRFERELGQGGMAAVYLAEDLKHHRRVAVKVLHPDLSAILGPDRFHKEIELTAALQHPHILPLFDSGAADGLLYYVMPYVEGETLRTRLTRDVQLSVPEAVRIASEVADALDYAHRHSVVHRDIKPENILLRDNHALVMDFGIALAVAQAGDRLTQTGTSLGTPQYMAPEQASGDRHIDGRADVYALGVVTYEMLVGEPPFTGPTAQAIMAKVMTEEPRLITVTRRSVPEHIESAVLTALQKVPADRFATPADFQRALGGGDPSVTLPATRARTAPPASQRRGVLWVAGLVALAILAYLAGLRGTGGRSPVAGFGMASKVTWERGLEIEPALSPDGKSVAYAAGTSQRMQIYVRQVAGGRPIQLTGDATISQTNPQWSGDGTRIYFVTDSGLSSAPAAGGAARPEMRTPGGAVATAAMSPDGSMIVFGVGDSLYLHQQNGENRMLAALREASLCQWAPSGRVVSCASGNAFYSRLGNLYGNIASSRIVTVHVPDGAVTPVAEGPWTNQSPAWSGDGRWLYY
ncbi:MAG TPA: protein kinase, partial [Gemmatimonadales bacterium]|nr:protein kinase [Gemmatimonadales bacterium]